MIKTIVFDLGGVFFTSGTQIALKKTYKFVDVSRKKVNEVFRGPKRKLHGKGKITKEEFWKEAQKKLKISKSQVLKLEEIWHSSYKPNKGMEGIVKKLRKNYRVIVFSGNIKERVEYLDKKYGLYDRFDELLLSYEEGTNKREIKFYKILLKRIMCKPKECVCIDDSERVLALEKSLGMKTILFKDAKQLKSDLKKLGVKV